jgi:hypothetical protein
VQQREEVTANEISSQRPMAYWSWGCRQWSLITPGDHESATGLVHPLAGTRAWNMTNLQQRHHRVREAGGRRATAVVPRRRRRSRLLSFFFFFAGLLEVPM